MGKEGSSSKFHRNVVLWCVVSFNPEAEDSYQTKHDRKKCNRLLNKDTIPDSG